MPLPAVSSLPEVSAVDEMLGELGLRRVVVPGNGNCGYLTAAVHMLAEQGHWNDTFDRSVHELAHYIRLETVKIVSHRFHTVNNDPQEYWNKQSYSTTLTDLAIEQQRHDSVWITDAFAEYGLPRALGMHIRVHFYSVHGGLSEREDTFNCDNAHARTAIFLQTLDSAARGKHFDAIIPL